MEIDFVIPWVDDQDPVWIQKKESFLSGETNREQNEQRFRDFGTLKYLIRSIEKNANWVHKIWIITDGQQPTWLSNNNSRVEVVDHKAFIPEEYLPTFNSNAIELNMWRIEGLSENFVALNDDFLFLNKVNPTDFFRENGEIVDTTAQFVAMPRDEFAHIALNNISLINNNFDKRVWLKGHWREAFSIKNGLPLLIYSLLLSPLPYFTRFYDPHVGIPFKKRSFETAWTLFDTVFQQTSATKYRSITNVSIWVIRYLQLLTEKVYVRKIKFGKYLTMSQPERLKKMINKRSIKMVVLNDQVSSESDEILAGKTLALLENVFSNKSEFEK
ncbi:stealth family protein [Weissella confusa]|uniref:stealth family protein n=1 Tax=Weissella confusa TaxID=1583 RepID=UPI001681B4EC|nr:stealth family protein [Weissella confusa]MBD1490988.1 sugar phosphotransferase [Weissella confusa]MBJ7662936.1 sugar phosphotransferase [Weissella confusa]MCT0025109.1 sugar phosphotransferase [Weissella confusa]